MPAIRRRFRRIGAAAIVETAILVAA